MSWSPETEEPIKVLIVDDEKPAIELLCDLISTVSQFEIVGTDENGADVLKWIGTPREDKNQKYVGKSVKDERALLGTFRRPQ